MHFFFITRCEGFWSLRLMFKFLIKEILSVSNFLSITFDLLACNINVGCWIIFIIIYVRRVIMVCGYFCLCDISPNLYNNYLVD